MIHEGGKMLTIYRSKRNQENSKEDKKVHIPSDTFNEADEMFNTIAKKWITDKATSKIDPQEMINKLFTSTEKSKLLKQGTSLVKGFLNNATDQLYSDKGDQMKKSSNNLDFNKIIESLKTRELDDTAD